MNRETLIEKLKSDIAAGRVVTITGTGVSVAACGNQEFEGYPVATWGGLLRHGVNHCRDIGVADDGDVNLLTMQIDSGKIDFMINAAETISQRMKDKSPGTFRGWLKDTIGGLVVEDSTIPQILGVFPGVLATLNYDNLIEDFTGRTAVTWLKADDVQDILKGKMGNAVLHLHGWFREPESVVLGLESYLKVKDQPHAKAVLEFFTMGCTLLFVGCGDTVLDPNFGRLIDWGREALKDIAPRHVLLCRTSEVAEFQRKLKDAAWLQPLAYGENYADLAPFLKGLVPSGGAPTGLKPCVISCAGFDLSAYQQAMRKRHGRLKLEELDPTTHDMKPLTLTGMFIEQHARECVEFMPRVFELPKELQLQLCKAGELENKEIDEELLKEHWRAYLDQSPRPILEIVDDPTLTRIVILGDPGSGKSTLIQYLLLRWAETVVTDFSCTPLPLVIELREYARLRRDGLADGFLRYLHDGASVRWHFDKNQLDGWLRTNPSIVMFDGLDEIFDPALRREISISIHRFSDAYPLARVIATSRVIGYQHQAWRDEKFRHFMLQELDEAQIDDFLARWHRGAYEDPAKGKEKHTLLARAIADSSAIRQLAGNPLLLTMMAIINRTQDLPRDRAELYEQCARLLLHQWKVEAAFGTDAELDKASLDFKDKHELLRRVAHEMQTSKEGLAGNLIDEETLERTLADGLKDVPNLRPERAARALIDQLRGRNFMLCWLGARTYAFVHRTFLEYFCAMEIRDRFQTEKSLSLDELKEGIFGHWMDEIWHEVLTLLAGMLAPRFVRDILKWLIGQSDPEQTCKHIFLAARCVGEVRKLTELGGIVQTIRDKTMAQVRFDFWYPYNPWGEEYVKIREIRTCAVEIAAWVWKKSDETRTWL
uniref:SIR2 family protein n=1 Tax=Desulfosarcina cetonica TaxID=90730 RepID=UPI0006D1D832